MTLTLHTIAAKQGSRQKKFRVGRGLGSGRGKSAGRGTKGQRSRTGGRKRLALKGMKQMLLSFPKNRGFRSRTAKPTTIALSRLEAFENGTVVTLELLRERNFLPRISLSAKIVGAGPITKKLTIQGILSSVGAKAAIEKAGGSFVEAVKAA